MITKALLTSLLLLVSHGAIAQSISGDSARVDYQKLYALCLDGDVKTALTLLDFDATVKMTSKDREFRTRFEKRFKNADDESDYLESRKSPINELLKIYRDYWRASLLDHSNRYDSALVQHVTKFLNESYSPAHNSIANEDSLNIYLKQYIESFGLHTTGFGKTGQYFDLLVWASEEDTTYSFVLHDEQTSAEVVFMDKFTTLGWEEYATLGRAYPGGWATKKALFCVRSAYDLSSEEFMISYLAHESRHFADYKLFPKLQSADLEYRAKLTELSMAQKTLFQTIQWFIQNANYESENSHSIADYCAIRDLSRAFFQVELENDIEKWKKLDPDKIHAVAFDLLQTNTKALREQGSDVEKFIKK